MSDNNEQYDETRPEDPVFNPKPAPKEEDEQIITMMDVLADEKKLEEEYAAVLGGSDSKFCTYSKVNWLLKLEKIYVIMVCKKMVDYKKRVLFSGVHKTASIVCVLNMYTGCSR